MNKKFFFFDIDGTLAVGTPGRQYIPESTKKAIRMLKEQGHFVAIATGRSYAMAVDHMRSLGFENMVSDGGNGITINNELITIKPLDYQKCIDLIDECKEKGFIWASRFYDFTHDVYMDTEVVDGLDPRNYDQIFKVYVACFSPEEQKLETLKELPWCRFHKEYLFVEPGDKSVGIKIMVDHFKGNEKNDLSMFRDEWTSIAMGNAIDELKEKATYVTTPCDQDGIYNACVHFDWIKEKD